MGQVLYSGANGGAYVTGGRFPAFDSITAADPAVGALFSGLVFMVSGGVLLSTYIMGDDVRNRRFDEMRRAMGIKDWDFALPRTAARKSLLARLPAGGL